MAGKGQNAKSSVATQRLPHPLGERRRQEQGQPGTWRVLLFFGVFGLGSLLVYAATTDWNVLGVALTAAVAAFAAGSLLGFLFGIPRTLSAEAPPASGKGGGETAQNQLSHLPNTNLEQISDWLTKILVGAGLVQLGQLGDGLQSLASGLAPGLGPNGEPVAISLLVSFSTAGFLCAYLFTRLRLQSAFALADLVDRVVGERTDAESHALALVSRQLDPGSDDEPGTAELTAALENSSPGTRARAFYLAREQRWKSWRHRDRDDPLVARTIPVFEALISCDREAKYHRNFGELGYALKDMADPDYEKAAEMLTKAIEIRNRRSPRAHFPMYEFNRAFCRIELSEREPESSAGEVEEICSDLEGAVKQASRPDPVKALIRKLRTFRRWAEKHSEMECVRRLLTEEILAG
jgi:hypothetical protein